MKKSVFIIVFLLLVTNLFSQKMITRSGEIKFDATVPGAMDEEIFRQHTINREVKIGEAATALQVKSPHLTREIALAQASVNYWNEVVENQRTAR